MAPLDFSTCNLTGIVETSSGDDGYVYATAWEDIRFTILIYGLSGIILYTIFETFRGRKSVYARRTKKDGLRHRAPPAPGRGPFQWLPPVLMTQDEEFRRMVGLDGFVCMRYIRWCLKMCFFCTFWCTTTLMPFYADGDNGVTDTFGLIAMDNIKNSSPNLWLPVIFAAIFTLYALYTLNEEWILFVGWRTEFLASGDPDAMGGAQLAYSIRVENLPPHLRSNVALLAFFEKLFPGQVHSAVVSQDLGALQGLIGQRRAACQALERSLGQRAANRRRRLGLSVKSPSADQADLIFGQGDAEASSGGGGLSSSSGGVPRSEVMRGWVMAGVDPNEDSLYEEGDEPSERLCCGPRGGTLEEVESVAYHRARLADLNLQVLALARQIRAEGDEIEIQVADQIREQLQEIQELENPGSTPPPDVGRSEEEWGSSGSLKGLSGTLERGAASLQDRAGTTGLVVGSALGSGAKAVASDLQIIADGAVLAFSGVAQGVKILTLGEGKSSSGFVTFRTKQATTDAKQVLLTAEAFSLVVDSAPDPRDIIWENQTVGWFELSARAGFASAAVWFFGLVLYIPLILIITSIGNIDDLEDTEGLKWLANFAQDKGQESLQYIFVTTQLPVTLQVCLLELLPILFGLLGEFYERTKTASEIQRKMMGRFFGFQLINIMATLGFHSFTAILNLAINNPACILDLIGTAIPATASYFAQLIFLKCFFSCFFELGRPWPLTRSLWFQLVDSDVASLDAKKQLQADTTFLMPGWVYPNFLLVMVICLTYAVIVPFIMVAGSLYFTLAYVIYRHQLLFVYVPKYETGGALFGDLYGYTLTGLNFANVTLLGYLGIKEGWSQFVMVVPLLVIVELFRLYTQTAYGRAIDVLCREAAVEEDKRDGTVAVGIATSGQPSFSRPSDRGSSLQPRRSSFLQASNLPATYDRASRIERVSSEHDSAAGAAGQEARGGVRRQVWEDFDPFLYRQPSLNTAAVVPFPPAAEHIMRRRLERALARESTDPGQLAAAVLEFEDDEEEEEEEEQAPATSQTSTGAASAGVGERLISLARMGLGFEESPPASESEGPHPEGPGPLTSPLLNGDQGAVSGNPPPAPPPGGT